MKDYPISNQGDAMNQVIQISLDELGRVFIPSPLREQLHLSPGMTLLVEKADQGGVRLRIQSEPPVLILKNGVLVAKVQALTDLIDVARHERDRRVFDLLQRVGL